MFDLALSALDEISLSISVIASLVSFTLTFPACSLEAETIPMTRCTMNDRDTSLTHLNRKVGHRKCLAISHFRSRRCLNLPYGQLLVD